MKRIATLAFVLSAMLLIGSCGGNKEKDEQTNAEEEAKKADTPADALQALADKAKTMGSREVVDPIDFRKLRDLLPKKLGSLERTEATGEKSGAMGFNVSTAQGKYRGDNDARLDIEIVDTGGIAGVSTMALAAWSMAEIDKETTTGYEKTTTLNGHKAYEKYDNASKSGEINVIVADRYIVNVEGNHVEMDQLKDVLNEINLSKLSELK